MLEVQNLKSTINNIVSQSFVRSFAICLSICLIALTAMSVKAQNPCITGNPIQRENCLTGTQKWQIPVGPIGAAFGVEGYSDQVSVNGDSSGVDHK